MEEGAETFGGPQKSVNFHGDPDLLGPRNWTCHEHAWALSGTHGCNNIDSSPSTMPIIHLSSPLVFVGWSLPRVFVNDEKPLTAAFGMEASAAAQQRRQSGPCECMRTSSGPTEVI
jgi:hypothetical protein